jgi:hypothetical protein
MLGRRAFKCSDTRAKLPYEDTFGSKVRTCADKLSQACACVRHCDVLLRGAACAQDWKYPHLVQDYDAHTELKRRLKWCGRASRCAGVSVSAELLLALARVLRPGSRTPRYCTAHLCRRAPRDLWNARIAQHCR